VELSGRQSQAAEGTSFLKKRSKKLLSIWLRPYRRSRSQVRKSFLVLFFKKELLPSFPSHNGMSAAMGLAALTHPTN
jgi:hypothetical protein